MDNKQPTKKQVEGWKAKADKWDALEDKISKFYIDPEGNEWPNEKYDLVDIGEAAAMAFGFL